MIAGKAKRFSKLSKNEVNSIFKLVSYNGLAIKLEEEQPPNRLSDRMLTSFYHNDHTKLDKLCRIAYGMTPCCSGSRADVDIRTSADSPPIIEPKTHTDSKDIPIIVEQYAQNEADSRVYTDELVNNVTRGGDGGETGG